MKEPTLKDFDDLFTRLATAGWIYQGYVVEDASKVNPLGITPTPLGDYRLRELFRFALELGRPQPTEGEWIALCALVLAYARKHNIPGAHLSSPPN